MRFYVHDFYFEDFNLGTLGNEFNFFSTVNVYFSFSPEDPGDGWGDLQHFNLSVCSINGFSIYYNSRKEEGMLDFPYLLNSLMIFERLDKDYIMHVIKAKLESISGYAEKEIMLKALKNFSWEWESDGEVMKKYYR